jgi:ZIP family zinc transporter
MPFWFDQLSPVIQALIAATGTWLVTALGAAVVVVTSRAPRGLMDAALGFAAGVMIAASCWSLLIPAMSIGGVVPAALGLALGAAFLYVLDQLLPHVHFLGGKREGLETRWHDSALLVLAITLHNIPEGLAVGVAFAGGNPAAAVALAVGIGLQNFPEGLAVAMPLRQDGMSTFRSFWYGQLSAAVEPLAAVAGAVLVTAVQPLLPYALAFAAGAMLYVVVEEMIPEAARKGHIDRATLGFVIGFIIMMSLDNAFR